MKKSKDKNQTQINDIPKKVVAEIVRILKENNCDIAIERKELCNIGTKEIETNYSIIVVPKNADKRT